MRTVKVNRGSESVNVSREYFGFMWKMQTLFAVLLRMLEIDVIYRWRMKIHIFIKNCREKITRKRRKQVVLVLWRIACSTICIQKTLHRISDTSLSSILYRFINSDISPILFHLFYYHWKDYMKQIYPFLIFLSNYSLLWNFYSTKRKLLNTIYFQLSYTTTETFIWLFKSGYLLDTYFH